MVQRKRSRITPTAWLALAAIVLAVGLVPVHAQGTQTSVISGVVSSSDGARLPGVAVTATSTSMQGARTVVTDASGVYVFRGLPPGQYKLLFEIPGFAKVERSLTVALGKTADLTTTLSVASLEETVEVVDTGTSILTETQIATNYRYEETVDKLAMGRTLAAIAELAPGLTDNGPNLGQVTIGGAFAYDNVFLLNGVDINDNLFGTANNLFIEDALQEISVMTSGISAEYGRFSGGVINAVTKSGGNEFSGSFRTDLTNPAWQDESKVEKDAIAAGRGRPHVDDTSFLYSATLGGPVLRDRVWFFGAYRRENSSEARALALSGESYDFTLQNRRYEGKLTARPWANHNLQVNYIKVSNIQNNFASINTSLSIDERTLINRETPNSLFVARYDGVLSSNLFGEFQYSQKKFSFANAGGTETDIFSSPFRALGRAGLPVDSHYNAPYFDATDPEQRDNRQFAGSLSYLWSTTNAGQHDLKFGGERFTSTRTGGNSQSSTSFVFFSDPVMSGGLPVRDAQGRVVPNFQPGVSRVINFIALRGAQININTLSLYLNDRWRLNDRWTFNLGVRMERYATDATQAGIASIKSSAFVPRLGATFDVKGDGKWILQATYGHYAGKAAETQFADNTNVGSPSQVTGLYNGPAGQGVDFAPGFNVANYPTIAGSFPVSNIFLDEDLGTPITKEWTLQAGTRLGEKGEFKVVYSNRKTTNFLEDFITRDLGTTTVIENGRNFGTFDNVRIRNTNDILEREYQALMFLANYRVTSDWSLSAHWTVQLRNHGNFEGEAANQPGNYSIIFDRPEFYDAARNYPTGRLDDYQQHKLRIHTVYGLRLGRAGTLSLGGLYRYDSALTYSLSQSNVAITPQQLARNPGYARPPATQLLFFAERGSEEFEASHLFDFSLSYDVPLYKRLRPFFKAELRNAFNAQPLIGFNTSITANTAAGAPRDALGLPTTYTRGALFGTPVNAQTANNPHVPFPREFRFSIGFRF